MKKNSWKVLLSVVLLLAMLMSMLPFAAFAEDGQTAAAQTEDAAKADEKTGDAPEGGTGGTPKDEGKADDAPKDEPNDANDDAARDENKDAHNGDAEQPAEGEAEDAAQAETLQGQNEIKLLANPSATLIYNANGGTGADYISEKSGESGAAEVFFKAERIERFTPPKDKEFSHWNTDPNGNGTTYNVGDLIIVRGGESQTLYAQWVDAAPKTVDITLTYDANGGTGSYSETKTFNVGEEYTFTVKSRFDTGIGRAKHAFRHWSVDKDDEWDRYYEGNTITVTEDTTLYAQWQYVPQKISVLYYSNNPMDPPEVDRDITEGTSYTVRMYTSFNPPYNKHFVNWNTKSDGSGTTYEVGQVITAPGDNLILVAQWADDPKWSELGIGISAPDKELPGADLTYAITVTNGTGYDLNSVTVDVALPAEVTYDESQSSSGAWSLSYNSATRTVTAKLESADGADVLALNGTAELNLPVTITQDIFGTIEAEAKIAGASSRTGGKTGEGSSAAAQTTMAGLDISVTAPSSADIDQTFTYTVTVTNNTGVDLSSMHVYNTPPAGFTYSRYNPDDGKSFWSNRASGDKNDLFHVGGIKNGVSVSYIVETKFTSAIEATTAVNTAEITQVKTADGLTVTSGLPRAEATVTLKEPDWSNLKIEKKVDKTTAGLGNTLTYTITVTNNTGCDLSYLCVEDPTPANTSYPTGSQGSGNWFLSIPSDNSKVVAELRGGLANGASDTFIMEVGVDRDVPSGKVESTAKITSAKSGSYYDLTKDHPGGLPSNTVTTVIDPMFNLDIEVRALQPVAEVGEDHKFTYEVTVRNNGVWLPTAKIENVFPKGVGTIVGTPDQNCGFSSDYSTVDIYSIPKGESVSYTITTNFVPGGAATAVLEAKITSVTTQAENTYTGSKSAKAAVYSLAGLTIEKSVDQSTAKPGDVLSYTVKVTNNTDTDLDEVYVNDYLPGAVTYSDNDITTVSGGNLTFDLFTGGEVFVTIPGLKKGAAAEYTVKATVNAGTSGKIESCASISSVVYDGGDPYTAATSINSNTVTTTVLTEVPVNVRVIFSGLEDVSQVPAGYKLNGADGNAFLKGEIGLLPAVKDNGVISRTFATTADVLLGQEYALSFTQSGYETDGYDCAPEASYTVRQTPTADSRAINVEITLSYTKAEPKPVEMDATVTVRFVGLDKDTKLPAGYALIGAPSNEFLRGAVKLTKDEAADTMVYTGKISALPGKTYDLKFMQSGFEAFGYICDAGAVVTKTVTADAKKGVAVELVLNYSKINWGGLTITKTANKTYATPGSYVKYTITVTNNTGVDLTNVNVLDYLPSTVRYSSSFGGYDSGTSSWTIAKLADGKSATATIRVKLNSGLSTGTAIENTAYVTGVTINGQEHVFENLLLNSTAKVIVTDGKGAPQTGDESNLGLWIAVMAASLACAGAAIVTYRKRRG